MRRRLRRYVPDGLPELSADGVDVCFLHRLGIEFYLGITLMQLELGLRSAVTSEGVFEETEL